MAEQGSDLRPLDEVGFLFVGDEDWDGVWRRSQHLVAHLARRLPWAHFLFVERPTDLLHGLRTGTFAHRGRSSLLATDARLVSGFENVFIMRAHELLPSSLPGAGHLSARLQARWIHKQMRRLLPPRPIAWVQHPTVGDVVLKLPVGLLIYDLTDNWLEADIFGPREERRLRRLDQDLTDAASAIVACSTALMKSNAAASERGRLIRNGVDFAAYAEAAPAPVLRPEDPTIGYLGTLHGERLDLNIIEALTKRLPAATVVLVGPDHLSPGSRTRLASMANVRILPPVEHKDVPAVLASFDVCVLPHRVTPFTDSLDPLKFLEYMAAWRPIVASSVSAARELSHLMDVAESPLEFADLVVKAVASPDGDRLSRARQFAANNSWDIRADDVISILENLAGMSSSRERSEH
jgi:teichuronic acid biosynthesis glycosyltransferase TuaH